MNYPVLKQAATKKKSDITDAEVAELTAPANKSRITNALSKLLMMPGTYRQHGRISALQEAAGQEPGLAMSLPMTHRALAALPLAVVGTATGGMLGSGDPYNQIRGMAIGGGLGALAGTGLAAYLERLARIKAIKQLEGASFTHSPEKGNILSMLVSGVHQDGRADTAEVLAGKEMKPQNTALMSGLQGTQQGLGYVASAANAVTPPLGNSLSVATYPLSLAQMGISGYHNLGARKRFDRLG